MTITKDNMGDLLNILLGENKREIMNRFTDAELAKLQENLDAVLSSADIFPATDIKSYVVDNFSTLMADEDIAVELKTYIIANIEEISGDTETAAALVGAGWTAPGN